MVKISNVSQDNTKGSSRLEFDINDINYTILNTLRRTILTDIPIYAFTHFKVNKNSSVFHNNFLKNQIKNIPVWGIDNKIDYFEEDIHKIDMNEEIEDMDDNVELTVDKKVDSTSLHQVTMYVDYENKSNEIESVTTDNAKFYFAQKQIENPYDTPIQLIKLQPKQQINFSVITSIGIEKISAMFSPVSICVYEQLSENKFRFKLESRGQISEKRILKVAHLNIVKKLDSILNQIPDNDKDEGEIEINNEDHTIGNLLSFGLQNNKSVQFAGYHMPHPLEKRVIISYKLKSGNVNKILKTVIEEFIEVFNKIDKELK
jgi:DNA-directed RNA polymerase subunit L